MAVNICSAAGECFSTRKRASISGRPFLSRALPTRPCPVNHKKPLRCRTRRHRGGAASFLPPLVARTRALPTLRLSTVCSSRWPRALSGPSLASPARPQNDRVTCREPAGEGSSSTAHWSPSLRAREDLPRRPCSFAWPGKPSGSPHTACQTLLSPVSGTVAAQV